jgi:hypothetical protein
MPCTALRCCWSNINFWNPPASADDESDGSKEEFHKEIEQMFHQLNYMNIVLRDQGNSKGRRYFHLHLEMRVHIKIEDTLVLE